MSWRTATGLSRQGMRVGAVVTSAAREIAKSFVAARRAAEALPDFPGQPPADLASAYRVQDEAIALWPGRVAGWKIGRVPPHQVEMLGADRLAGPIFDRFVWQVRDAEDVRFPVYENGFAAVEAEYVFRIGQDAPPKKTQWTRDEAAALASALLVGVETAGSPLATINDLGATVVVSDFGNNHGLILGAEIPDWRAQLDRGLDCETYIDDERVGAGNANGGPDGPLDALVFLLGHLAERGKPLQAGQLVSTGAVTGVHDIRIGQRARVRFGGDVDIFCTAAKATPLDRGFT